MTTLEIPPGTIEIEAEAYKDRNDIAAVRIPPSVTKIGRCAFQNCGSLETVHLPDSLTDIGAGAFQDCKSLETVHLPDSLTEIGDFAFNNCGSLKNVRLPDSLTKIGEFAFRSCHPDLAFGMGLVTDPDAPNRFPVINQFPRTAMLQHEFSAGDCCIVRCVWLSSTTQLPGYLPTYAATAPAPPSLVDGAGIVRPFQFQTLAGDEYPIHGCWGTNPVVHPDFKRLAASSTPTPLLSSTRGLCCCTPLMWPPLPSTSPNWATCSSAVSSTWTSLC